MVRASSWIVCFFATQTDDPRTHTKRHEHYTKLPPQLAVVVFLEGPPLLCQLLSCGWWFVASTAAAALRKAAATSSGSTSDRRKRNSKVKSFFGELYLKV